MAKIYSNTGPFQIQDKGEIIWRDEHGHEINLDGYSALWGHIVGPITDQADLMVKLSEIVAGVPSQLVVVQESLAGVVNGVNVTYHTTQNIKDSTSQVFVNGLKQRLGIDYTESSMQEITFDEAPSNIGFVDDLEIIYLKG